jgi:hypothetical protein
MDMQELGCGVMEWMEMVQDRDRWRALVTAVKYIQIPYIEGEILDKRIPVSFFRKYLFHGVN